jgi:hypothetical protein
MCLVKGAAIEPAGVFPRKHPNAHAPPDRKIALVAQYGRRQQDPQGQGQTHQIRTTQSPGDEKQRVAGQKRHHHHASFNKNYRKQQGIDPDPVGLHKHANVAVHVQHKIHQISDQFHGCPLRNYRCCPSPKMPQ